MYRKLSRRGFTRFCAGTFIGAGYLSSIKSIAKIPAPSMNKLDTFLNELPKVELHLHLEGAIPLPAMWELVRKYNKTGEIQSFEQLKGKFEYVNFYQFLDTWIWKNQFINKYEDFEFLADAVARSLIQQNIKYAEIFYSPVEYREKGLSPQGITEAIAKGLDKNKNNVQIYLVPDLVRNFGPENGMNTLLELNEVRELGLLGIGIGGSEKEYPPELFTAVYEKARGLGFKTSAHAGEANGPSSIWGAIKALKVDRIGHGTRAFEDPELVDYLAKHQTPIETCPLSNVKTRVVDSISEHPVGNYFRKGLNVFVNTDDPSFFGNSLVDEYKVLIEHHDFKPEDIKTLVLNAISSSWANDETKSRLRAELDEYSFPNHWV